MNVHPIEEESYRILRTRVDLSGWEPGAAAIAERVVHATGEPSMAGSLVVGGGAVDAGVRALAAGAPVLCDVEMVRAGVPSLGALAGITNAPSDAIAGAAGFPSRSAAGIAALAARHPEGAVVVVGCSPTALFEVNRLIDSGNLRPALVVGAPVGFVGAADSKEELLQISSLTGVPAIVLRGERGGAAVAAAVVNALSRMAKMPRVGVSAPGCLLIGHGTRSADGAAQLRSFTESFAAQRPDVATRAGFIEWVDPTIDDAIDDLVGLGARSVVAVPLVLLGAGHMKDDGPAALSRARLRHPGVDFAYARDLDVHPQVLAAVEARARACAAELPEGRADAVVVVGRGSTDPDANANLAKAARLLADSRGLAGGSGDHPLDLVVPAFVSLAPPGVQDALSQCERLGARRIAVVPYFLFNGLLIDRIRDQVDAWARTRPALATALGRHIGIDPLVVSLAWHRYDEARGHGAHMNCDGCIYRAPIPGYEGRVGVAPFG